MVLLVSKPTNKPYCYVISSLFCNIAYYAISLFLSSFHKTLVNRYSGCNVYGPSVVKHVLCQTKVSYYIQRRDIVILPVSQFILPPGQLAPWGASQPRLACPPGGKLSRDILPPALVILTPGEQAVQAGLSCPPPI